MADQEIKDMGEEIREEIGDAVSEDKPTMKASTEANRRKKTERREAKAARKEANRKEEKKRRPSNILLAILIFGVVIVMFAFAGGYNYFQKPANIEKYVKDQGIADRYNDTPVSENVTLSVKGKDNTLDIEFTASEDAGEDELGQYTGDEGTEYLKNIGSSFLTSIKPEVRGFGGEVNVSVKQGDETVNSVSMSYSEAKKYVKEAEEKAAQKSEKAGETSDESDGESDTQDAEADTKDGDE